MSEWVDFPMYNLVEIDHPMCITFTGYLGLIQRHLPDPDTDKDLKAAILADCLGGMVDACNNMTEGVHRGTRVCRKLRTLVRHEQPIKVTCHFF